MEHRALALEYRPQTFSDVAGQHHVTAVLTRALAKGRVHSCYLFSGPRGVGKTTTARILAKILNCPNVKDGVPCNACETCREITAGVALDVQEIDGASNRGIADVQQLREKVRFTPSGGRYRVIIIDEVHQLSGDAFAALLKTLEEPPPHVVFVFATTDPLKLPDTIRSRCQRYDFGRLSLSAVVTRLKEIAAGESERGETRELTDEAAFLLARRSEGSMRDAVSALDQVLSTGVSTVDEAAVTEVLGLVSREVFLGLGGAILQGDPEGSLAALHGAYREGIDPRDLAEGLLDHLRAVLVLRLDPRAEDLVTASAEERTRFEEQGKDWDTPDLIRLMRLVTEALGAMRDSAQPLTHLELAVVEMASLEPGVRLAEILNRLGVLAGGSADGGKTGGRKTTAAKSAGRGGRRASPASGLQASAPVVRVREASVAVAPAPAPPVPGGPSAPAPPTAEASSERRHASQTAPPSVQTQSESSVAVMVETEIRGEPAEAAIPATPEDECWHRAVAQLKERKVMVGVFLEESRLARWEDGAVHIAADDVHKSFLSNPENRELIESALAGAYGKSVRVKFVDMSSVPAVRPAPAAPATAPSQVEKSEVASSLAPAQVDKPMAAPPEPTAPPESPAAPGEANGGGAGEVNGRSRPEPPAARRAKRAAVSPEVEKAMVWLDADIVKQDEPGGSGR
jgi:DNA polymerase-3 subunit gamma/tau